MCRPGEASACAALGIAAPPERAAKEKTPVPPPLLQRLLSFVPTIHPLFLVASVPLLPTSMYLNRGYTIWFQLLTVSYLLCRSTTLRRFLIFMGTSITLGWYAAILNDLWNHGRFFHILYLNTPGVMMNAIFNAAGEIMYTPEAIGWMALVHAADTLAHPGLVYLLWRGHKASGRTLQDVMTWGVLVSSFLFSRLWSAVHTYHNTGTVQPYYFGYDVYIIHDLDSWVPAYAAEGALHLAVAVWKLTCEGHRMKSTKE